MFTEGAVGKVGGSSCKGKLCFFELAVNEDLVNIDRRPAHLTPLVHAGTDEAVGDTFDGETRNRFTRSISAVAIGNRSLALDQVGLKVADQ